MLIYFYDYVSFILRVRDGVNEVHKYVLSAAKMGLGCNFFFLGSLAEKKIWCAYLWFEDENHSRTLELSFM